MTIEIHYSRAFPQLEAVLRAVRRAGDFHVHGTREMPMPRLEIEGVGVLSFPVPAAQIRKIVRSAATRAPYGRGEETILDLSVRKVWQLEPTKCRIGGQSWSKNFQAILYTVARGLGCEASRTRAELYKLLIYERGGFFKAHRDTEKADGMFGTLVIVLPSTHRGGQLVVRHAGHEEVLDLSRGDTSELTFAAFYADCEHEVRPITSGQRVCLIYNLLHQPDGRKRKVPVAPHYDTKVARAAEILTQAFKRRSAPTKLTWLLNHQYSPAGLSFSRLKGEDAARVQVLRQAAQRARCALHLAVVHIEEYGSAELHDSYYGWYSHWRYDDDDDDDEDSDVSFDVVEVHDSIRYLDHWITSDDRPVYYGRIPLGDGEVLPTGALAEEKPDEQRVLEATGNEGASFERSYHRAALVIWPLDRFADVLLQAGVGAVLPYFEEQVDRACRVAATTNERQGALALAHRIIGAWERAGLRALHGDRFGWEDSELDDELDDEELEDYELDDDGLADAIDDNAFDRNADRAKMVTLLGRLEDATLLERFISRVVCHVYDGSENEAIVAAAQVIGAEAAGRLFTNLVGQNTRWQYYACQSLLHELARRYGRSDEDEWKPVLQEVARAVVDALPELLPVSTLRAGRDWWRARNAQAMDGAALATLLENTSALGDATLRADACAGIAANTAVFDPRDIVLPALESLPRQRRARVRRADTFPELWQHVAEFLLARSEFPPEPPRDWRQDVTLTCSCADCVELQKFAQDAAARVHRFRVRKDRRQHLHRTIQNTGLDMAHVTERKGSPQTLVCTKTLHTFEQRCEQHAQDCTALARLVKLPGATAAAHADLAGRAAAASERVPLPCSLA
jgi:hypothetical protein